MIQLPLSITSIFRYAVVLVLVDGVKSFAYVAGHMAFVPDGESFLPLELVRYVIGSIWVPVDCPI